MDVLSLANRLEGILRKYLKCHYTEFRVKANGYLDTRDWKSAINFALGCKYAESGRNAGVKADIDNFLGNTFIGENIADVVDKYEYYGFSNKQAALSYTNTIIDEVDRILNI